MPYMGEEIRFGNLALLLNSLEEFNSNVKINWYQLPEALIGSEWAIIRNENTGKWELFPLPMDERL